MGLVNGKVVLRNPRLPALAEVEVDVLAASGAVHLCIPEPVRAQLKLEAIDSKEVTLADGRRARVPYVGPIEYHVVLGPADPCFVKSAAWPWR